MEEALTSSDALRTAVSTGDYGKAAAIANSLVPGVEPQVEQFRVQMEVYAKARVAADWRRALRALADARMAAIAIGLPELEALTTDGLYDIVRRYEGRKA